jgi:hypothetical protein
MADYSIEVSIPNVGPQGPQGEVGPVGPANELSLGEITTGDAGTEAEATISGTPPNQVLGLVLPRGDTGAQGNPGPTGAGGIGVVPAPIYATMQEAVEDGITFGGVFRHTSGSVYWVEEPDPDAATFIAASGATDTWNIQQFVKGVKALGLWDDMVCWPLRSAQNAGTGTTAYSLGGLGTFNGTLVGGPSWTAGGINYDGADDLITTSFTQGAQQVFCGVVGDMPTSAPSGGGAVHKGNFLGAQNSASQAIYWVNPRSGFGAEYRYGGSNFSTSDNATSGVQMWSTTGGVGLNTKGYRSLTLLGTAGGSAATAPDPLTLSAGLALGRSTGSYEGTAAFAFVIHDAPAAPDDFYTLYKSTLGLGLSLP